MSVASDDEGIADETVADESIADELRDAAPYGVAAYAIGLGISFLVVSMHSEIPGSLGIAGVMHGLFHLVVEGGETGRTLLDADEVYARLLVAVPALPVVVLAHRYAAEVEGLDAGDAVRRGVAIAGGYAGAMLLGALFFDAEVTTRSAFGTRTLSAQLDPATALVGGLLVAGGFGALGGALASRSNKLFYLVVALLSLPVVLVVLGASAV